jgi:hypothetical protein
MSSDGTTTHIQGDVGVTGTPDVGMTVDNTDAEVGQAWSVTSFQIQAGNQ